MKTRAAVTTLDEMPDVMSRTHMERLFDRSPATFTILMRKGQVPDPLPMDGHPRWSKEDVRKWLSERSARRGLRRVS